MKKILLFLISFFLFTLNIKASSLPTIYFYGDISNMESKSDVRKLFVSYESDTLNFETYAKLKIQGSSSLSYEKKNYNIEFYKDNDFKNKNAINLGWGAESKYCLKANWIDKTHARNIVTARLASLVQERYSLFENTPNYGLIDGYPAEIYINGEFLGLYTVNIPKSAWMFNMDEENENHIVLSGNSWTEGTEFYEEATFADWEVEVGKENEETLEKLNRLIRFVLYSSDEDFKNHINEYFNLNSLLNYYVLLEYASLIDNSAKNMLLVTYDGQIWYTSLYDLDTSWGTVYHGLNTIEDYTTISGAPQSNLFTRLVKNFGPELSKRYFALRENILTTENVLNLFNAFESQIPEESFLKESNRWSNIPGYDIDQIKDFLETRTPVLDKYFLELNNNLEEVKIKYQILPDMVIASFNTTNENITLLNDEDTHNFTDNGEYTFYYKTNNNTTETITAKVDWIDKNYTIVESSINFKNICLIIIILIGLIYIIVVNKPIKKQ